MHRREFLRSAAAAALITSLGTVPVIAAGPGAIPRRTFGRHADTMVSILGIGGAHIGEHYVPEDVAIQIVRTAIDSGVNFLDNAWDYNNGVSEQRMGMALRDGYRDKVFLMTKLDARDAKGATDQLNTSLQRLGTGHLDLIQLHDIHGVADADKNFAPGGAIEACVAAQKAGKVRYIGFTGHKDPEFHLHMLAAADQHGFLFDSVQMPLNVMDAHFLSFTQKVLPEALKRKMAVLGMKPIGARDILKSNTVNAVECLQYAMSLPVTTTITGCDSMEILNQALGVARDFQPLGKDAITAMLARTESAAAKGEFEHYKFATYPS
ncbi:MAG TPA: aldo/keto reductase [Candidatus Methylacidiphilales bacterium]|jgi:predicted aldo/keto reductase-like oxidoreductase|nr:aldo/keto reductase [Candidatus Methylacidiphilales bacterium]